MVGFGLLDTGLRIWGQRFHMAPVTLVGLMFDFPIKQVVSGTKTLCLLVEEPGASTVSVPGHNSEANNQNIKVHRL